MSVTTPGSIHEGGELGYAMIHAFGAAFDNPDLLTVAVVGDGEAETGPLEGSWKGISFLNPAHDGPVLPVLHLNGAKIAAPTVLARKPHDEVEKLFEGHGYEVIWVEGDDLPGMHFRFAEALSLSYDKIQAIVAAARDGSAPVGRPRWPMIIFRSPKGWTGPDVVDGVQIEGTWRAHQVPLSGVKENPEHLAMLEAWMKSYRPEELFDDEGALVDLVHQANPEKSISMSGTSHANGGLLSQPLDLPDFRDLAVPVEKRATELIESTRKLGELMKAAYERNPDNFRLFSPDEANSNRLGAVFDVSDRAWMEGLEPGDVKLSQSGRVMEVLSEHNCHGWLEAYTLTGRHGLFATYEAFSMVSASQTVQHAKWLQEAAVLPWRAKVPSLNILLSSTRVAQRPQRVQPPGTRPHPGGPQPAQRRRPDLPASGRELPALGRRPLLPIEVVRQPHRHRQAAAAPVAVHGRRHRALRARRVGGGGRPPMTAMSPTWCSAAPETSPRWRRSQRRPSSTSTRPSSGCEWSTWSTCWRSALPRSTPTRSAQRHSQLSSRMTWTW